MPREAPDGPEALAGIVDVSRETLDRLQTYVALLRKWQPAENLVAPSTLGEVWRRHVADSAQIVPLFPAARTVLDIGSGGGFPGLVIACLLGGVAGARVHLVESNSRKCAFLRRVAAEARLPATVRDGRIEAVLADWRDAVDLVTARALAPLGDLLGLAAPVLLHGGRAAFHKGRDFRREIEEASQNWTFDLVVHKSRIDADGAILEIANLARKGG
ncbi:MAG TPA: 16S rRNA (guanine(527)-N(7))-methyltransferase RsmG [Bauldia sp.]|nr:16S rRNA (guanine(527)-N(7))-methyltransferase RsmG [Bauldia sp.]